MEPRPTEFDFDGMPRAFLRGLRREPVEDLIRRLQWDYAQLAHAHRKLQDTVERLENERSSLVTKLQSIPPPAPAPAPAPPVQPVAARAPEPPAAREEHDVLEAAYRRAREVREDARNESTLALRKAHQKVADLERDFDRIRDSAELELQSLVELVPQLQAQLRAVLHLVNARSGEPVSRPGPEHEDEVDRELLDVAIARDRPPDP